MLFIQQGEGMAKVSDCKVKERINNILRHKPYASTLYIKQRLINLGMAPKHFYPLLTPFYEKGLIDDRSHIERDIHSHLKKYHGFSYIARMLSSRAYNYIQVEQALLILASNINPKEQALLCKQHQFGASPPKDPHQQSMMVITLQKQGHKLPDIWYALKHIN